MMRSNHCPAPESLPSHRWRAAAWMLGVALLLALAACQVSPSPTNEVAASPSPEVVVTLTPEPTSSPSPLPETVVLVIPEGAQPVYEQQLWPTLQELSASAGLLLEKRQSLADIDYNHAVRVVIAVPPLAGLAETAEAHPQVQFVAVEIPGQTALANLSLISPQGPRSDQQGFVAGYLAAVLTSDWRVGVVSLENEAAGRAALLGFANGAVFFCGLCRPYFPPFVQYPVTVGLLQNGDAAEQAAAAQRLISSAVKTVYIYPGVIDAGLLEALSQAGLQIIGGGSPPPALRTAWVATIQVDLAQALRQLWPNLLAGQGGQVLEAPLQLTEVNSERLSAGRQRLVEKLMAELAAGYVDTGVDPQTGAAR